MKRASLINVLAFNAGWFACVLSAAKGMPVLGVLYVFLSAGVHLAYHRWSARVACLYLLSFVLGVVSDGALVAAGVLSFPEHSALLTPLALWMPFMWINFATSLHLSLSFLRGRPLLAAALGAISAPGTYYAGMKLGAVTLSEPLTTSLIAVAVEWAIAMPLLVVLASIFSPRPTAPKEVGP